MRFEPSLLLLAIVIGCAREHPPAGDQALAATVADSARPWRKQGDKIDSILPMEEYLRRFRTGLTEPKALSGGEASPERLARRFLAAVAAGDTSSFANLAVSRAEFAWLVFPLHIYARPPYDLDPEIFWLQLTAGSAKGLGRTLQRYGGTPLAFLGLACRRDTLQISAGPVQLWVGCDVRFRGGDGVLERQLFGSIVLRNGVAKLLSFANDY